MASLLSYALTNLADVKETLGIASSDTTWDNLIIRKINQATLAIENYTGRRFAQTNYIDEEYDSTQTDQLILKNRPITAFTSLSYRNTSLNESDFTTVESNLIFADNKAAVLDLNFRANGHWNRYKVTYSAGYATIPEDLAEACATLAAYYTLNADTSTVGISEKKEGQRSIRYGTNANVVSSFDVLMGELGIDGIINNYSNFPLLADK